MAFAWDKLPRPFFILAPMDDVTDVVFRERVAKTGRPDVFVTEFTNCDALFSPGRAVHGRRLEFTEKQRPIIAQIWGANPETYFKAAQLLAEAGFDGIDINMGCPDKTVMKTGSCSALIDNHQLAAELITAVASGAPELPLSVKTRLGIKSLQTEEWIGFLLEQNLAAIAIHGRTVREQSDVPAHWDEIARAVRLRDEMKKQTIMIGNGDVLSLAEGRDRAAETGVEGVMIGRGIFQDVLLFSGDRNARDLALPEILNLLREHAALFDATWGKSRNPANMKKFVKAYIHGFPGALALRARLMETKTISELVAAIDQELSGLE